MMFQVLPYRQPDHHGASTASAANMDIVFIEGFEGETLIGIDPPELRTPQRIRIDAAAGTPRSAACDTDRITDTIDYGKVRQALLDLLQTHRVHLLEALAEKVAQLLIDDFGAHWVHVVVVKPHKFPDVAAVGVVIERRRAVVPEAAAHSTPAVIDFAKLR